MFPVSLGQRTIPCVTLIDGADDDDDGDGLHRK